MKKTVCRVAATVFLCFVGFLSFAVAGSAPSAPPSPEPFVFGAVRVTALQDMPGEMPLGIFRGVDDATMKNWVPSGSVPAGVTVFLVQNGNQNILVDTGYGLDTPERKSALPQLLGSLGVTPEAVHSVLLTHMHGDHVGGLLRDGKAVFPNATIRVSERELGFWTDADTLRSHPNLDKNVRRVLELQKAYGDKVKTFAFGEVVVPDITAHAIAGHTPGHTMFLLKSSGEQLMFWGDLIHGAALQFANPAICATYDMDMEEAVRIRRETLKKAADERIPVAGAHLPFPAIGRVAKSVDSGEFSLGHL